MRRRSLVGAAIIVVVCTWAITLGLLFAKQTTPSHTPSTTPTTRRPVATTTTTYPYANLRASLLDYCAATHRGKPLIVVKNGAPIGGCTG